MRSASQRLSYEGLLASGAGKRRPMPPHAVILCLTATRILPFPCHPDVRLRGYRETTILHQSWSSDEGTGWSAATRHPPGSHRELGDDWGQKSWSSRGSGLRS
jgi:hypothetical protein